MERKERKSWKMQVCLASCLGLFAFSCQQAANESGALGALLQNGRSSGGTEQAVFEAQSIGTWVSIRNLRDKSIVETGFLIGQAFSTNGVLFVQVSLDGGAYKYAKGTTSWSYKLPAGTNTWKQGSQHTISVRCQSWTGTYSSVQTITVRKGNNKDINGDGYGDIVSTAVGDANTPRKMFIFYGSATGVSQTDAAQANRIITGSGTSTGFGSPVVLADVTGDGYADIVASARKLNALNHGGVYFFYSKGSAGVVQTDHYQADNFIQEDTNVVPGHNFGASLAAGDINGDGFADIVVGTNQQEAYVFYAVADGEGILATRAPEANQKINGFLGSLAVGDVNGDGYADLAAAGIGYNYIFYSKGSSGISASDAQADADKQILGVSYGSIALGDFNGDGCADIVLGDFQEFYSPTSSVYVFHYNAQQAKQIDTSAANTTIAASGPNTHFGFSLDTGDIDGDGDIDLLASAPGVDTVYVFKSQPGGISATSLADASTSIQAVDPNTQFMFGGSIATSDVNGDGSSDLIVGDGRFTTFLFHSTPGTGFSPGSVNAQTASRIIVSSVWGFGAYVAMRAPTPSTRSAAPSISAGKMGAWRPLFNRAV